MRAAPVRRIALLEIVVRLHRAPLAVDAHLNALAVHALVFGAQLAAILIVAAAFVLLVHPILIIGVMQRMMLLRTHAQWTKHQCDDEERSHAALLCWSCRSQFSHAISPGSAALLHSSNNAGGTIQ